MTDTQQAPLLGAPEQSCDIVLKGGITSGVVYPLALVALAKKYRFSSIGGTSAGAIAAAATAAAEYGRPIENAGFDRLKKIPDEVGPNLLSLFQPVPTLRPLFDIFVATLKAKSGIGRTVAIAWAAIAGYRGSAVLGLLPGLVIVAAAWLTGGGIGFVLLGLLSAIVGLAIAMVWRLLKAANTDLVAADFGLCPGLRQPRSFSEGFADIRRPGTAPGRPSAHPAGHDDHQPDGTASLHLADPGPALRLQARRVGEVVSEPYHGVPDRSLRTVRSAG
jgi:hypothetical protein